MTKKHRGCLGEWAKENGHKKWEDHYHPVNRQKRIMEGIKYYNRRHNIGVNDGQFPIRRKV